MNEHELLILKYQELFSLELKTFFLGCLNKDIHILTLIINRILYKIKIV